MTYVQRRLCGLFSSLALASILSSCGGGGGSCGKVTPCGGDVVGSYTITAGCINNAALNMQLGSTSTSCPGLSVSVSGTNVTGSGSFNADMTYTVTETVKLSAVETIPTSCLSQSGVTLTCAQLDQALQQEIASGSTTISSGHCSGTSSCTCSFTIPAQTTTETGTYTTSGTTITMTPSTGTTSSDSYCVQGNELHVMSVDMTMPMGTVTADIVFKKN
jgi:hypothetical protein